MSFTNVGKIMIITLPCKSCVSDLILQSDLF